MQKCRIIRSATRGRSGFFPLEIQVSRSSRYTGRATYVVFPLGTDCDTPYFRLAPASARIVGVRSERSRTCAAGCYGAIDTPWYSPHVVLCSSVLTLKVRARLGGLQVYLSAGLVNVARS